jgi:hypothetical protein
MTAVSTAAKKGQCMAFDHKVLLLPNRRELGGRKAEIDIDHAMALCAGKVMVVVLAPATHSIVMGPIRKFNAVKQSLAHQFFDRTIDGCAADAWLDLAQLLPQFFHSESGAMTFKLDQAIRNELARARISLA